MGISANLRDIKLSSGTLDSPHSQLDWESSKCLKVRIQFIFYFGFPLSSVTENVEKTKRRCERSEAI